MSSTFANAIASQPVAIDVARARAQHDAYAAALSRAGVELTVLPGDDAYPDGCFVEDCAVVVGGTALITRPGAPSRRGEVAAVRDALSQFLTIEETPPPATLDGGDCVRVGDRLFIGRSARTNEAGIARARDVLGLEVVSVPVDAQLHLKSVCSPLDDETILLAEETIDRELFPDVRVVMVPAEESFAANAIALENKVIAAAGCPRTHRAIEALGREVIAVDTSEIRKADGALTCLSIVFACLLGCQGESVDSVKPVSDSAAEDIAVSDTTSNTGDANADGSTRGPAQIPLKTSKGEFAIDATEVSNADYKIVIAQVLEVVAVAVGRRWGSLAWIEPPPRA